MFGGNKDGDGIVYHKLNPPIQAHYQTQANSVVRSYFTEDGTVRLCRYDCNLTACNYFILVNT